jgi:pyridoxamine 5'-phosphate oxidase
MSGVGSTEPPKSGGAGFAGAGADVDPLALFHEWIDGNEMVLATATADGRPSARMLLLKAADERGFTFFSNYESRKGQELASNPYAALLFRTPDRQVRVEGRVERIPADESDAYWATRPAASRRSAAASHQSQPIDSRSELEAAVAAQPAEPPRPPHWGGYRLTPEVYEFWLHRDDRLHERHLFRRRGGGWQVVLLQP